MNFTFQLFCVIIVLSVLVFLLRKKKVNEMSENFNKIRDVDYRVVSVGDAIEDASFLAEIELLTGEFKGVRYTYGNVSKIEENENDEFASLSFEFNIMEDNGLGSSTLEQSDNFKNEIGEILVSIIVQASADQAELESMMENAQIVEE